jgi:hypothetical protein
MVINDDMIQAFKYTNIGKSPEDYHKEYIPIRASPDNIFKKRSNYNSEMIKYEKLKNFLFLNG